MDSAQIRATSRVDRRQRRLRMAERLMHELCARRFVSDSRTTA